MQFRIVGEIRDVETIAAGTGIDDLKRLKKAYGSGRWRKRKGIATVEMANGEVLRAEVHWYEAHGIGKRDLKIKKELP